MSYSQRALQYFHEPAHATQLHGANVQKGTAHSANQDEVVEFYLALDNAKIIKASFQAHGSVALLASAEFVCEWLEGKSFTQVSELTIETILEELELPRFRNHSAALVIKALSMCK